MGGGGAGKRKTRAAGEEGVDADDDAENLALQVVAQKPKTGGDDRSAVSIAGVPGAQRPHPKKGMNRTSSLDAPIMLLEGHGDAVNSIKFSPDGATVASCGADKTVLMWNVRGDCENYMMMQGHKNSVLELHWTADGDNLLTCSPDKTLRLWDATTGESVKCMKGHQSFVNACSVAPKGKPLCVSGSDDGTAKLWDFRRKGAVATFADRFQVTAVAFNADGDRFFSGGLDNDLKCWDLRNDSEPLMVLPGHTDTITGIACAPDGSHVLTNAMDCTLRAWDVRSFAPEERCVKYFVGHQHNFEKGMLKCGWSPDGTKVTAGSACRNVFVWDFDSRRVLYKLPGHDGAVNETSFHPTEPIVGSAGSDGKIFLGELAD